MEYLSYRGISKYKFSKETGLSNGFLDRNRNMGSDKCEIILVHYPDINPEWLITGRGNMLRDGTPPQVINTPNVAKEMATKDELIQALQGQIQALQNNLKDKDIIIETLKAQLSDLKNP